MHRIRNDAAQLVTHFGLVGKSGMHTKPSRDQVMVIIESTRNIHLIQDDQASISPRQTNSSPPAGVTARTIKTAVDGRLEGAGQHETDWGRVSAGGEHMMIRTRLTAVVEADAKCDLTRSILKAWSARERQSAVEIDTPMT